MWHRAAVYFAAVAVETDVGEVMLAAAVEATRDLHPQRLDGSGHAGGFGGQTLAQLGGESATRGNAELAGIGAGA